MIAATRGATSVISCFNDPILRHFRDLNELDYMYMCVCAVYICAVVIHLCTNVSHTASAVALPFSEQNNSINSCYCMICSQIPNESTGTYCVAPCGHVLCGTCMRQLYNNVECPYCRTRITQKIKLIFNEP